MSHLNGLYPANLIDRMEAYLLSQMAAQGGIPPNLYSMHGEYNCIPPTPYTYIYWDLLVRFYNAGLQLPLPPVQCFNNFIF